MKARVLWLLGFPDRALEKAHEALTLANELSHPFSLAFAIYRVMWSHRHRGEVQSTKELVNSLLALADEHAFLIWRANAAVTSGWLLVSEGRRDEGLAQLRQAHQAAGIVRDRSDYLALLADGYGKAEKIEEALNVVGEGLDGVEQSGERYYEAELLRIKGELLLKQAVSTEHHAETCFQQAIEVGRGQSAKSLELRAAMSLSRLWQSRGKKDEARRLLGNIYAWFSEGFATSDLKAAKRLLEELGG